MSFSADLSRGLFHCFSRNEGGDCIRFFELMHGLSFLQAVKRLARELGLGARRQSRWAVKSSPDKETEEATNTELIEGRLTEICSKFLEICGREDQAEGLCYLGRRGIDASTIKRAGVVYFPRRSYRRVMRELLKSFKLEELQASGLFNSQAHLTFYRHRLLFPFYIEGVPLYLQARTTAAG